MLDPGNTSADKSTETLKQLKLHAEVRRLLSAFLCMPDKDKFIQQNYAGRLADTLGQLSICESNPAALLADILQKSEQSDLAQDFARLFSGTDSLIQPLMELSRTSLTDESTCKIQELVAEEGLDVDVAVFRSADHVAIELEFSFFLLNKCMLALRGGRLSEATRLHEKLVNFEAAYVKTWLPELASAIDKSADTEFLKTVAACLKCFARTSPPAVPGFREASS